MIVRNPNQRVAVLVDVQNLYYSARNLYQSRINFKQLIEVAVQGRILTRAIAYVIKADDSDKQEFFEAVNAAGFETKEKDLQIFFNGAKKGDWDIGIAMDAIRLGHKVDSIVLVSGDGDFVPVVNYLQQSLGCLVEVMAFKQTANHDLISLADDFINIDERKDTMLFATVKSKGTSKVETTVKNNAQSKPVSSTKPSDRQTPVPSMPPPLHVSPPAPKQMQTSPVPPQPTGVIKPLQRPSAMRGMSRPMQRPSSQAQPQRAPMIPPKSLIEDHPKQQSSALPLLQKILGGKS
jgi:uncharacterized LabA/DUF88 family protein